MLQFLPLIFGGISALSGLFGGMQASAENEKNRALQEKEMEMMRQILGQITSSTDPAAYEMQAKMGFDDALGALASRGLASSGVAGRGLAATLVNARLQAQNTRISALGQAMGGHGQLAGMYGQNIDPNPYGGVAAGLGAMGNAAGALVTQNQQYLSQLNKPQTPTFAGALGSGGSTLQHRSDNPFRGG